jgi:hypothetical protein
MLRTATAIIVLAALAVPMTAAPVSDWKQIDKAIDSIPTAAGISLKKRLAACKVVVHKDTSSIEILTAPAPDYDAKPGQTLLKVMMDFPAPAKQPGQTLAQPQQKNVAGIWVLDHGKATPISSWANALQNIPVPLGYDESKNC